MGALWVVHTCMAVQVHCANNVGRGRVMNHTMLKRLPRKAPSAARGQKFKRPSLTEDIREMCGEFFQAKFSTAHLDGITT